jgi:acyl-CoA thioester hydrolase
MKRDVDLVFVVRAMQMDFRAPARLDDQLSVSVRLLECRGASLLLAQRIQRDGVLLVEAKVKIAALYASSFRPRALPDALLSQLTPLLESP